jgi:LuxR family transcriptional regulator, maltose regulon positive regulatory protein
MPRVPLHALIWSTDRTYYELFRRGQLVQRFRLGDDEAWLRWLAAQTAFVFHGRCGRLNVHNEARTRRARYWYAYHATEKRILKCYLGKTANLTLARLEQVATALTSELSPAPLAPIQPARERLAQPQVASPHASRQLEQRVVLLATKLAHPRLPAALVVRERLLHQLDAALSHQLTLLSASAGWGKTTLLSAWASKHPEQVAWLSLDALDNDLTRFWIALIAALRRCAPDAGAVALAMLLSPEQAPLSAILTVLLNDLASVPEPAPMLLILDDYHLINDEAIHESVTFLLEHLPHHLHLVIASRVDPDLPLSRWRVRGELLEIRAADLRFGAAEATSFFTQTLGGGLAEDDVRLLEQRTEGWIAGLQLAMLAMRQREDRLAFVHAFTGSHRYLLDYVQEEILERQGLEVQRFLLQTAVLTHMNAALCVALTEERNSQAMLEWLERNNLFVVPLDEQRHWYRMHDLFREALLAHLQATEPELVPVLHQRAAHWYEAQGEVREAIAHALDARDFVYAATLIEREAGQLWLSGEVQIVQSWIGALPDFVVRQHARLALNTALRLLECMYATVRQSYARAQAQVEQTIARVEAVLQRQQGSTAQPEAEATLSALTEAEVALMEQRIRLLRALIAARESLTRGDAARMRLLAQETEMLSEQEELSWRLVALWISFWLIDTLQGEGALLIGRLLEAKQQAIEAGDQLATVRVMRWLASAYLRAGRLRLVEQECLEALALQEPIGEHFAVTGYFHFFLAHCDYASNRLEAAAGSLQQQLRIAQTWQQAHLQIIGNIYLAQLALARGDLAAADQALLKAEGLVQREQFATDAGAVVAARVQYWLAAGNLATASTWSTQVVFSPESWDPNRWGEFLMLVRVYLAQQHYAQALAALEGFSAQLDRPGDIDTTIHFLALQAVARHSAGQSAQARAVAARLLALTEPEGYIRVYLDLGEPMQRLLQSQRRPPHDQENELPPSTVAFVTKLLAVFPRTESPGLRTEYQIPEHSVLGPQSSALVEPLTPREQQVLRLLLAGASNQEIASELVISLATVKKHVSNLLGKLGVASRTQAIVRAREWSHLA